MNVPENILDLVRKLAAVTIESGSTPSEVAKAAEVLQNLLTRHQLTLADIPNKKVGENVVKNTYTTGYKRKLPQAYCIYATHIASAWRCRMIRSGNTLLFIGFATDAALAEFFFHSTWKKVRGKGLIEARRSGFSGRQASKFAEDFAIGAAAAIRERMRAFDPEVKDANALVCLKAQQVDEYVNQNMKVVTSPSRRVYADAAFTSGRAYGATIDLNPGISGKSSQGALNRGSLSLS